jgi:hypothetical protein
LDPNFGADFLGGGINFGALPPGDNSMMNFDYTLGFGLENNLGDMTIDDPAKRLFSKQGGMNNNQLQFGMKSGPMSMDGDLAKRLREQQLVGGLGGPIVGFPEPEQKPFKCPVIGCEKSYKNQNGLKYHKQVILLSYRKIVLVLIFSSMDTKISNSKKTKMALTPSWIQRHQSLIPELLAWKKRSHIDARHAANDTRILTASNITDSTHLLAIPS